MNDFWIACGHHLLDRDEGGGLCVTDEFLKAYFARPELMPPDDACPVERRLHRELLADPRQGVGADEIAGISDADARENWRFVLAFRDLLLRHPTLEAAYLASLRSGANDLPPLFVNQLVHVILRNALDGCDDPFVLRAAELFFRVQRILPHEQALLLGDEEIVGGRSPTPVLSLMSMLGATNEAMLDILSEENVEAYWQRSDQFDMALDLTAGGRGPTALAQAMMRWVSHLLGIEVTIEPLRALQDAKLTWYVGLDTEATRLGDRLWQGEDVDERDADRVLALFRLIFADSSRAHDDVRDEPVYLILSMTADQKLRMKPQNLLTGLPVKRLEMFT
ncbi:hypothetical protein IVB14_29005 [Bradyrhizobium sp. 180]|uniref:DUF6352 family protein n=1 Tax=unclassified Bradyrhizobium TaxID=2631580 RepID=UPI001FF7CD81|nr:MULTISPECIES: DUF6352 family protein [unclassified Bradyrhizobium]MCK1421696.1 hypothetical protein [Bradyrhizobium sp. CW12]MCK1494344.1 hypothetical protein [Bradyrhizobium sp. 180]MCK1530457.1 hypothetical protein [Bradyrhizobium sp. 182]MCK1594969.1 hypothetical protein [Bradyrhizobium sp. 164]MCK1615664.1 hypothetical protein [Bradyrhizobium sp. 159]